MINILPNAHFFPTYRSIIEFSATIWRLPAATGELLRRARCSDVVLCVMPHLWQPPALLALSRLGVPFVPVIHDATPHPGDSRLIWAWQHLGLLAHSSAIIVLSQHVADMIRKRAPFVRIHVLPLPAFFVAGSPQAEQLSSNEKSIVKFLFFGRLSYYKGLDILSDAFQIVRKKSDRAILQIVGQGNIDQFAPKIRNIPGVLIMNKWIPEYEIPSLISSADVIVLPYREASQSGIIPQALALGKPVIVTPVGGLPEQVPPGAGLVAKEPDAKSLAESMLSVLDPLVLKYLSEEAKKIVAWLHGQIFVISLLMFYVRS